MARHEFGIMDTAPQHGERYDAYEPEKYGCISVDDEWIEQLDKRAAQMDCFWHTIDCKGKGLAYCGVTLIPPDSLGELLKAVKEQEELRDLRQILEQAKREMKFVIHFGL